MVGFWRPVSFLVVVVVEEREKGGGNWFSYRVLLAAPGFFWLEATWATEEVRPVDVNWLFFRWASYDGLAWCDSGERPDLISFEAPAVCLRPGWFLDLLLSAGLFFYSFALASSFSGFRMGGQTNTKHDMGGWFWLFERRDGVEASPCCVWSVVSVVETIGILPSLTMVWRERKLQGKLRISLGESRGIRYWLDERTDRMERGDNTGDAEITRPRIVRKEELEFGVKGRGRKKEKGKRGNGKDSY